MKEKEFVSIIMAEYNTKETQLLKCIESILSQTYSKFELIIIDDCGKNDLNELLKKYNDSRIKIFKNTENIGLAMSLNKGIKLALYDYIVRMDTDDIMFPDRIEKQLKFALEHKEYSIIGSRYRVFNEKGIIGESNIFGEISKEQFLFGTPFAHPTLLINKMDLINSGMYPNYRRCQDYAMEMQMYSKGYKGYIIDEVFLEYRQDDDGYKKRKFKTRLLEYKVRKKYFKILNFNIFKRTLYMIKPLIIEMIPLSVQKFYHEKIDRKYRKI